MIQGICNRDPATTVLAHVGRHGTAKRNQKYEEAGDVVYACSACHDAIDFRDWTFLSGDQQMQLFLHREREKAIVRGKQKTQSILRLKGLIK
jgi:hypothetical protein